MPRGRISAALLAAALACAGGPSPLLSPELLRSRVAARLPDVAPAEIPIPHRVTPALARRARGYLRGPGRGRARALDLAASLSDPERFGLRYRWAATRDAVTTVAAGGGNCLSLSAVLLGLARELGFRARYVAVSNPPEPLARDGPAALSIWATHVAVALETREGRLLVDWSGELGPRSRVRVVSDLEAVAHFYNNRGYEELEGATRRGEPLPWEAARELFWRAARVEPAFAPAWNNLGVALARLGRHEEAARIYREALQRDPALDAPARNLVSLEWRMRGGGEPPEHAE